MRPRRRRRGRGGSGASNQRSEKAWSYEAGQEAFQEYVVRNTPLGREQTPADVAEAALYLARADNVTGVSLNIAGGTEMN